MPRHDPLLSFITRPRVFDLNHIYPRGGRDGSPGTSLTAGAFAQALGVFDREEFPQNLRSPATRRFAWIGSDVHSRETVTCPVPLKPIALAAAGDRSISLPDKGAAIVNANRDAFTVTDANPRAKRQPTMSRCHC